MAAQGPLEKLLKATKTVYGQLPSSETEAERWTPPPNSGGHKGRYLWTDAFGVLNFITLFKESSDQTYLTLAQQLVTNVHDILGRTRDGSARLNGATDSEPLKGGLRIGKVAAEGQDEDGQYHHYLTLWMFALNRLSVATSNSTYNDQAISLAQTIHRHFFIDHDPSTLRMVWKISTDMSAPLVTSQGSLDPVDGSTVYSLLQSHNPSNPKILAAEIATYAAVIEAKGRHRITSDTLDLGMTLWSTSWNSTPWAADIGERARTRLYDLMASNLFSPKRKSLSQRLAFREFGACLGVGCLDERIAGEGEKEERKVLEEKKGEIVGMWEEVLEKTPEDLVAITSVMYGAAVLPGAFKKGYLGPEPAPTTG